MNKPERQTERLANPPGGDVMRMLLQSDNHHNQSVSGPYGCNAGGRAGNGLIYPVWAMVAMAASVTAIFINSLWQRPSLLFEAVAIG